MAKIYLIRHGESIANTLGIYQGQTFDTSLSPLGERQVSALNKFFSNISVKTIYTSPLTRTRLTAQQVSLSTGVAVTIDKRLLETNHGEWEGLPKDQIQTKWGDILSAWNTNPVGVSFPGGETFELLQARILNWFKELLKEDGDIAVVTHDNVIRVVVAHLLVLPPNKFWQFPLDPAGVTTITINNGIATLDCLNENTHLSDCLTNLSQHAL